MQRVLKDIAMKPRVGVVLAALLYWSSVSAQESMPAPTRFEVETQKPGARITLEHEVGSLEAADVTMRVNALVVDDSAAQRMGGVRIDFEGRGIEDHVYLDQEQATTLRRELGWIEESVPELRASRSAQYRVEGTQSCWMPSPPTRILCPEYYVGPDKATFRAGAYRGHSFEFPEHTPADLQTLIDQAIAVLAKR